MTDSDEKRRKTDHWSVSKEVSIGNIVTTIAAVVSIVIFLITNRNDIDVNTNDIAELNKEKSAYITIVKAEGDHNLLSAKIDSVGEVLGARMDGMENTQRNTKNSVNRNGLKLEKIYDILLEWKQNEEKK